MGQGQDRRIFKYWAGPQSGPVHGDPVAILRGMTLALAGDINALLDAWRSDELLKAMEAEQQLMDAVRSVFRMDPWDAAEGKGATDSECRDALEAFLDFFGEGGQSTGSSPTSPPSTGPEPYPYPTPPSSASGPTSPG